MQGRILFVTTVYTHLAAFHIPFIKLLQSWGYEVHAAASPAEGRKEEVEAAGAICWDIPFVRSPLSPKNLAAYRKLKGLLSRERFDLIHVHTPMAAWLGRLAARRTGQGPVLYTAHGFHFYKGAPWPYWLFYYPAERLAARWTDDLIVMKEEDLERAKQMGFREEENLFLVHGVGVDLERFSPTPSNESSIRGELSLGNQDVLITCAAEFIPRKNHAFLLAAWQRVVREESFAHLLLVGDGGLRKAMEHRVSKERIPRVHFFGFRKDVPNLLQATDVFVLPSRQEGLPRAIMEASASGLPIVATDVGGNGEVLLNGTTGLLVPPRDANALAEGMLRLMTLPEPKRQQMGQRARQHILANFSMEHIVEQWEGLYLQLLEKKGITVERSGK